MILLLLFTMFCLTPAIIAFALTKQLRHLRDKRIIMTSAAPVPILIVMFSLKEILSISKIPVEQCGIYSCSISIGFLVFLILVSLVGFLIGLGTALVGCVIGRESNSNAKRKKGLG